MFRYNYIRQKQTIRKSFSQMNFKKLNQSGENFQKRLKFNLNQNKSKIIIALYFDYIDNLNFRKDKSKI